MVHLPGKDSRPAYGIALSVSISYCIRDRDVESWLAFLMTIAGTGREARSTRIKNSNGERERDCLGNTTFDI